MEELEAGIEEIRRSPKDEGVLKLIVRRPATLEREMIQEGQLDPELSLAPIADRLAELLGKDEALL